MEMEMWDIREVIQIRKAALVWNSSIIQQQKNTFEEEIILHVPKNRRKKFEIPKIVQTLLKEYLSFASLALRIWTRSLQSTRLLVPTTPVRLD